MSALNAFSIAAQIYFFFVHKNLLWKINEALACEMIQ